MSGENRSRIVRKSDKTETTYDLIIIGGGISGACLLWDATLRGMKTLLLEKNDFASGTTQATSKLIHGGLRYLKNLEFGLVRESLRERRLLARLAPHSVRPMPFLHAMYKGAKLSKGAMSVALTLYDILSFDRNRGLPDHLKLPKHKFISAKETLKMEPTLKAEGLEGAHVYYDYQNINPERLCCEFIFSAVEKGANARNYTEVKELATTNGMHQVVARDTTTGESLEFSSRAVVNAAGPWADIVDRRAVNAEVGGKKIQRSMGIHLITRKITGEKTVVLHREDGSHFFIIPWRGHSLIGTTDFLFTGNPDEFQIPEKEIIGLLNDVNRGLKNVHLTRKDVQSVYGGLRPLVEENSAMKESYSASRRTEIEMHPDRPGFFTVLGGKYTTSRHLAERTIDMVASYVPGNWKKCETDRTPLRTGDKQAQESMRKRLLGIPLFPKYKVEHLIERYGILAERILNAWTQPKWAGKLKQWGKEILLSNGEEYYPEEIAFISEFEMVKSMEDLILRRTGLATAGDHLRRIGTKMISRPKLRAASA